MTYSGAVYRGARWMRADLHLHSPASFSFSKPAVGNAHEIAERYVHCLVEQRIEIAALTDYQMIHENWLTLIRDKAKKHGILVYAGAELSFRYSKYGLHVLAIFPLDGSVDSINKEIASLDQRPSIALVRPDGTHRDIDYTLGLVDCLQTFRRNTDCLLLFPHPSDMNGLFKSHRPEDAALMIKRLRPDAIECFEDSDRQRLLDTGQVDQDILRRVASIECSGPKSLAEVGTKTRADGRRRITYLKLSDPTHLDALRLALHDSELLVRIGAEPRCRHTCLLALQVEGQGFLGTATYPFSPELNTFIGSRGAGKSAVLEMIRYTLDLETYEETAYRNSLVPFAMGSGGKATLFIEKHVSPNVSRRYRVERIWGEPPRVFELEPDQLLQLSPLDVLQDRDRPLFFGQRELYAVTSQDEERLRLLDSIVGEPAQEVLRKVSDLEHEIGSKAKVILDGEEKLLEREDRHNESARIAHEIELFRRHGIVDKVRRETNLTVDQQRLEEASSPPRDKRRDDGVLQQAMAHWRESTEYLLSMLDSALQLLAKPRSEMRELVERALRIFQNLRATMAALAHKGSETLAEAERELGELFSQWQKVRQPLDDELRSIRNQLGRDSLDPTRLMKLMRTQVKLEKLLEDFERLDQKIREAREERGGLVNALREARHEAFRLRQKQAKAISEAVGDPVEVGVSYEGDHEAFCKDLRALFKGSGVSSECIETLVAESGGDGLTISGVVRQGPEKLQEQFGLTEKRALQVWRWLDQHPELLLKLESLVAPDRVTVFAVINGRPHPLERLSSGEKATVMLLILLSQEDRLLFLDQPEDDLDDRFIYEDIVRLLRDQKGKRQLVMATHNPNTPVLTHAEQILALDATDELSRLAVQGAIDNAEVQTTVKGIMEGGEEALRRRAEKYGWFNQ